MRTLQEARVDDATVRVEYQPLLSWLSEKALLVMDVIGAFASRVELVEGRWLLVVEEPDDVSIERFRSCEDALHAFEAAIDARSGGPASAGR